MPSFKKNNNGRGLTAQSGFIQAVLLVVAALVLIKYVYEIDVVGFLTEGRFKELLDKFYSLGSQGWAKYSDVVIKVWNYIIELIKSLVQKLK